MTPMEWDRIDDEDKAEMIAFEIARSKIEAYMYEETEKASKLPSVLGMNSGDIRDVKSRKLNSDPGRF